MRPAPLRPAAAPIASAAQPQRYLTNDEAADYLRLSPRTLEKQRVLGGGPKFRKFGRRVMYAVADLDAWATDRSFESTSDPEYAEHHAAVAAVHQHLSAPHQTPYARAQAAVGEPVGRHSVGAEQALGHVTQGRAREGGVERLQGV